MNAGAEYTINHYLSIWHMHQKTCACSKLYASNYDPCGPSEVTMNAFRVPKSGRHHGNISGLHVAHRYSFDHTANPLHLIFTTSGRTIFNSNFEGFWS